MPRIPVQPISASVGQGGIGSRSRSALNSARGIHAAGYTHSSRTTISSALIASAAGSSSSARETFCTKVRSCKPIARNTNALIT